MAKAAACWIVVLSTAFALFQWAVPVPAGLAHIVRFFICLALVFAFFGWLFTAVKKLAKFWSNKKQDPMTLIFIAAFGATVAVLLWVLFAPPKPRAPRVGLAIAAEGLPNGAAYTAGETVAGVVWKPGYIPVKIILKTGDRELQDMDIKLCLDHCRTHIMGVGHLKYLTPITTIPTGEIWSDDSVLDVGTMVIEGFDSQGKRFSMASEIGESNTINFASCVWRVHIKSLPPDSTVTLVVAGMRLLEKPPFLPADKIGSVLLKGRFTMPTSPSDQTREIADEFVLNQKGEYVLKRTPKPKLIPNSQQ